MAGRQIRVDEGVVAEAQERRAELGFPADATDSVIISELTRDGMRVRLEARRRRERIALYAEWAQDRDLRESVGQDLRGAIDDGVA